MLRYKGYDIDRSKPTVTITAPSGKLVHAFAAGTDFHRTGTDAMRWIDGLGTAREPDPHAERIQAECAFIAKIKRENARGTSGVAKCPFCECDVQWRIAGSNGHILARCTTDACFGVME